MKTTCLVLLLLVVVSSTDSRHVISPSQFLYVVSIQNKDNDHICGGTIISKNLILTAAHCVYKTHLRDINIVAGTKFLSKIGIKRRVVKIVRADYNDEDFSHDIALLKLSKDLPITDYIQIMPLSTSEPPIAASLTTCGWGMRYFGDLGSSDELQSTEVTAMSLEQCREQITALKNDKEVTSRNICTLSLSGKGLCTGDSGGPLVYEGKLVGIVSYGGIPCARGYPDVYTKVSEYYSWIQDAIELIST